MRTLLLLALGLVALTQAVYGNPLQKKDWEGDEGYGVESLQPEVEPPEDIDFPMPSEEEAEGIAHLGMGIAYLANIAGKGPKAITEYIKTAGEDKAATEPEAVPYTKRGRGGRGRGRGGAGRGRGGGRGRGRRPGPPKPDSEEAAGPGDEFMAEIMEKGVYQTVVDHVQKMSYMMSLAPAILAHATKGPDCQDCPTLPQEVKEMIFGELMESGEDDESDEENDMPYPMKGSKPYPRPGMKSSSSEEQGPAYPVKGNRPYRPDNQPDKIDPGFDMGVDGAFGQLPARTTKSKLAKRLLALLAKNGN